MLPSSADSSVAPSTSPRLAQPRVAGLYARSVNDVYLMLRERLVDVGYEKHFRFTKGRD
jgi:hypothetical protein